MSSEPEAEPHFYTTDILLGALSVMYLCTDQLRIDYCKERLLYKNDDNSGTKNVTYMLNIAHESSNFSFLMK